MLDKVRRSKETALATPSAHSVSSAEDLHAHSSAGAPTSDAAPADKDGLTAANHAVAERTVYEKPRQTWRSNLWDTLDKSPEERNFLLKPDIIVLTFASLGYCIKCLDQVNLNNYMATCWTVGYVIGEIPSNPMAAVYHLDGVHGYKGWQWLFIIDTAISMPVAIAGFFVLPDVPEITRAWYFTPDEIAIAKRRMVLEGRTDRPLSQKKRPSASSRAGTFTFSHYSTFSSTMGILAVA